MSGEAWGGGGQWEERVCLRGGFCLAGVAVAVGGGHFVIPTMLHKSVIKARQLRSHAGALISQQASTSTSVPPSPSSSSSLFSSLHRFNSSILIILLSASFYSFNEPSITSFIPTKPLLLLILDAFNSSSLFFFNRVPLCHMQADRYLQIGSLIDFLAES